MSCPLCFETGFVDIGEKNGYKLVTCSSCGFIYVNPMPTTMQLEDVYKDYRQTKRYLKKLRKKIFTSTFKLKRLKRHQKISGKEFLDVGCSIGATVEAAHRLGYQSMGIDLDKPVVTRAQKMFPHIEFNSITTELLVKNKRTFDFIYCAEVIEHVPNPRQFVKTLTDLMNENALLYITTPDAGHRRVPKNFVNWNRVTPPEHICYFSRTTMQKVLEESGLTVIKFYWSHRANLRVLCYKTQILI